MLNKKSSGSIDNEATFCINMMQENGKTYILRFKNDLANLRISKNYNYQIGIATPLQSTNNNGFPNKEENEQLLKMEQVFENEYSENDIAVFVGAIMGGGMKEFVFYTGKPDESTKIFERLKREIKHHKLQCIIQEDPEWKVYKMYGPRK